MTLLYASLLALVLAAVGVFVVVRLRSDLLASTDRNLQPAGAQIARGYEREGAPEFRDSAASLLAGERATAQVLEPNGRVVLGWGDTAGAQPLLPAPTLAEAAHRRVSPRTITVNGHGFRVVAQPVVRRGAHEVVVTAVAAAPVDRSVHRVTILLLLAVPAALLMTAAGGWWLAGRALRPIDQMTRTAAAIDAGQLEGRVAQPAVNDELGHLAGTLNAMLDRVQAGVEEQRRLVADAAHELRTPLAAMRAELDVSLRLDDLPPPARTVLQSVREEVDSLTRTVANLLTLASVDAGELALRREPLELSAVAAEIAALVGPVASAKDVELVVDGAAEVLADGAALKQVVRNLVENAVEFSPDGGRVEVRSGVLDGSAWLAVLDSGPGIQPEDRERIFERFYRVDPSRSRRTGGSGLGLAIARELVEAHDGRLWVEERSPHGAAFTLELRALMPRSGSSP